MKKTLYVLVMLTLMSFSGQKRKAFDDCIHSYICCQVQCTCCQNGDLAAIPGVIESPDVKKYIDQLRQESYTPNELPNFNHNHIPSLLAYRNEADTIKNFPINGLSSFVQTECTLGMYVLWTIESIRVVSIEREGMLGRFPSQNPIVQKRDEPFEGINNQEDQAIVAKAYFEWWKTHEGKAFDAFKQIDPLMDTEYRWH